MATKKVSVSWDGKPTADKFEDYMDYYWYKVCDLTANVDDMSDFTLSWSVGSEIVKQSILEKVQEQGGEIFLGADGSKYVYILHDLYSGFQWAPSEGIYFQENLVRGYDEVTFSWTQPSPVNKVDINGKTVIDLTSDTVTPEHLASGYTAHDKSGALITGKMQGGIDTSDATATAAQIVEGYTAYTKDGKVEGALHQYQEGEGSEGWIFFEGPSADAEELYLRTMGHVATLDACNICTAAEFVDRINFYLPYKKYVYGGSNSNEPVTVYDAQSLHDALAANKDVILGTNISLQNYDWLLIGDKEAGVFYTGTIFGNGKTLNCDSVHISGGTNYFGLISAAKDASVYDLTIDLFDYTKPIDCIGALFGYVEGDVVIRNVTLYQSQIAGENAGGLIGLVGKNSNVIITDCHFEWVNVDGYAGGLCVGYSDHSNGLITDIDFSSDTLYIRTERLSWGLEIVNIPIVGEYMDRPGLWVATKKDSYGAY